MTIAISARRVLHPDGTLRPATIELDGDRIALVEEGARPTAPDVVLAPGFIDLQVNGHADVDVATAGDGDWDRLDGLLLAQGVTTWCPTLVTGPLSAYAEPLTRIARAAERRSGLEGRPIPTIAGAHLEGPFLGGAIGAHRPEFVAEIDERWLAALPPVVCLVTLAPEASGAPQAIAALRARGITVSLGHSTASYEEARAAIDAGARLVTHLFNGMAPFHHRQPGLVGAALTDDRVSVSLIADGVHLSLPAIVLAFRAKAGSVALVTDAVAWQTGTAGTVRIHLSDGVPRLANGTIAGSALTMDGAIRTCVGAGVPLAQALWAATGAPADVLQMTDRGRLRVGGRADVVALNPDLTVGKVWVAGQPAWP